MTDRTEREGLRECPFCGGAARVLNGGPGNHFIQCSSCRASTDDGSLERAITAWNRRPTEALAGKGGDNGS